MADPMFVQPYVKIGGKRKYTVLLSIVAHTLVIAVALIVPLVATDAIVPPTQFGMMAFHGRPPLPPSPPPPSGLAVKEQQTVAQPTVPIEAPDTISEETTIQPIGDPFDPVRAKQLLADAQASGASVKGFQAVQVGPDRAVLIARGQSAAVAV